jgi:soluble lytic murein transglycosylase-like protein
VNPTLSAGQLTAQNLRSNWKTNVVIGVEYLKQHVVEFRDKLAKEGITDPSQTGPLLQNIIAAAYNAGEGAVRKYWDRRIDIAAADPTRSIVPYKETKNYVIDIQGRSSYDFAAPVKPAPAVVDPAQPVEKPL